MSDHPNSLVPSGQDIHPALVQAVDLWATANTNANSSRRRDLIRDKTTALVGNGTAGVPLGFFTFVNKPMDAVTPLDVKNWQSYLENMGLSASSVYARISRVSSFYKWVMNEPAFRDWVRNNPVDLARPKSPKPYQTEKTQSLTDEQARRLLQTVKTEADTGNVNARRDYALLRFYFATGKRRSEIIDLKWGDLDIYEDAIILQTQEKGGLYRTTEIRDPGVRKALFDYLVASGRWDFINNIPEMFTEDVIWLRHDRAAKGMQPITSHGFVKALKKYARKAGIGHIHLHQTRHTVARMVGEDSGNLSDVQTVLGHQNIATTRVYLSRVSVKKDRYSESIARRLNLDEDET